MIWVVLLYPDISNFTFWNVKNLKCKNFLIDFLNELGNFKQKNFCTSKRKVFLHFTTTDPRIPLGKNPQHLRNWLKDLHIEHDSLHTRCWTPTEYQANLLFAKSLHMILISNENWKTWCVPGVGWKKIRSRLYFLRHTIYIVQYNTWGPNIYYRCTYKSVTIIMVLALHVSDSLLKKH